MPTHLACYLIRALRYKGGNIQIFANMAELAIFAFVSMAYIANSDITCMCKASFQTKLAWKL